MKKEKSILKKYISVLLMLFIYIILYLSDNDRIRDKQLFTIWEFAGMLSLLFPTYLLVNMLDVWVKKETMIKLIGKGSGFKGIVISFFLGTIGVGPLYMTFPIMALLLKKGASKRNTFIFMGSWSSTKITQIMFEIDSLGIRYTVFRLVLNIISICIMAVILEHIVEKDKDWEIKGICK